MKRLCSICARGGSKGIKNKNLYILDEKPLIAHSILQAKETGYFDHIAVSSDSDDILKTAKQWGADIIVQRPLEMASDTAAKLPVIRHCLLEAEKIVGYEFDTSVDLDATAPIRTSKEIKDCVDMLEGSKGKYTNIITGTSARKSPYFNMIEISDSGFAKLPKKLEKPIIRRQDSPKVYDMNASIYVWTRSALLNNAKVIDEKTGFYEMPPEHSIDIDHPIDLKLIELIYEDLKNSGKL